MVVVMLMMLMTMVMVTMVVDLHWFQIQIHPLAAFCLFNFGFRQIRFFPVQSHFGLQWVFSCAQCICICIGGFFDKWILNL